LLDALAPGTLAVDFDPGNLAANGHSPVDAVAELGAAILHVHAKDGTRDLALGRGVEVPLGRGSVDWAALLGALEEHGYRGYFTIERENADDPVLEVAQAMQFLRAL
jgi:sugar phosphate isomerase/epimerase